MNAKIRHRRRRRRTTKVYYLRSKEETSGVLRITAFDERNRVLAVLVREFLGNWHITANKRTVRLEHPDPQFNVMLLRLHLSRYIPGNSLSFEFGHPVRTKTAAPNTIFKRIDQEEVL